jgi:signal transduction histidine kinase
MWPMRGLVNLVARAPARIQGKLLAAFLAIAMLLIMMGVVGLQVSNGINQRTEELVKLQRKIEAYRQVQNDTTSQLYGVSSALLSTDSQTLESTLRQLNQFGYDVDRLQFVAKDEIDLLAQFTEDYDRFVDIVTSAVELIRAGHADEARQSQIQKAAPLADRLERLTSQLVNKAEADMVAGIEASAKAYATSQIIVIAFALGSIVLALGLGYVISWSLVGPVKDIQEQLTQVAAGDFTQRIRVDNRDELGALADNVNQMSEELGRLYKQLEAAGQHKSQFLANMSHELRTPLNAILGYVELILDNIYGETPEKMRDVLNRIERSGEAQRRRRRPRPAAIDRAAEAEAPVVLTPEAAGPATRLAPIVSRMNNAVASLAPGTPSGVGEVAITGEQQLVECGVGQHVSVQRMRPPRLVGTDHNGQARTQ